MIVHSLFPLSYTIIYSLFCLSVIHLNKPQRDPFYVLNLEAGKAPQVSASLKLDGFSTFLMPVNDEATILVGLGQNVTGTGLNQIPTGVMATVFDVSDPEKPLALASRMVAEANNTEVMSNAL